MSINISVITATYRDPRGLELTADSLKPLVGSGVTWEHVLVDSSPDENAAVLPGLGRDWPLVHVNVSPEGIYAAFNTGLEKATGGCVWFLNGGDRLKNVEALRRVLEAFASDAQLDLALARADLTRDGRFLYPRVPRARLLDNLIGSNRLCHQAVVYRRSALARVGRFSTRYRLAGDYEHHLRCYAAGLKSRVVDDALVEYDTSGSSRDFQAACGEFKAVHRELRATLPAWVNLANAVLWPVEPAKDLLFSVVKRTPLAGVLRKAWFAWNR